jgi:hypothetical protein
MNANEAAQNLVSSNPRSVAFIRGLFDRTQKASY